MNTFKNVFLSLTVSAFLLGGINSNLASAQGNTKAKSKYDVKELLENAKVHVVEVKWAPGGESTSVARPYRVLKTIKGGTLQRIYPDGKKEVVEYKTGQVATVDATEPYLIKNIGKTDVVLFVVFLK